MKYKIRKLKPVSPELEECFKNIRDTQELLMIEMNRDLNEKREILIRLALEKHGYELENKHQLYEFAKNMCEVRIYAPNDRHVLCVDGVEICEWNYKIETKFENNKFTATGGTFNVL